MALGDGPTMGGRLKCMTRNQHDCCVCATLGVGAGGIGEAIETICGGRILWPMTVLSTTLCYPNSASPTQGIFVRRRLVEIARLVPLVVAAPVPWFPMLRPRKVDAGAGRSDMPPVWHPRMFYLPGILKQCDASFYERALARAYGELSRVHNISVIDAHFEWPDAVGAFGLARRLRIPFVCTLRGKLVSQSREPGKRRRIVEMLKGADALISVSASLAKLAREVAGADLDVRVIPNGIDTDVFHRVGEGQRELAATATSRSALGWTDASRIVISVGHLQELKGFHRLVAAWPGVRKHLGDVRLVLVGGSAGDPAFERALSRQIADLGLAGHVTLTGRVEPGRIAQMLNAADLFVLASRSEGWCNAIAEALACGCPVVATDVGGNRELVHDSSLGRLIPLEAANDLETAICDGLTAAWDRRHIAEIGGSRPWQQVAAECVDVLYGVTAGSNR